MGKVRCLIGRAALLVGFLGGSVLMVDMARVVKKIRASSVFGLQVMPVGSLGVSGPYILQLSLGTRSKIASDHSACNSCCSRSIPLLTPCTDLLSGFHANYPFHSHA